jgi:hypothetical protein
MCQQLALLCQISSHIEPQGILSYGKCYTTAAGASSLTFPVMRELLEEVGGASTGSYLMILIVVRMKLCLAAAGASSLTFPVMRELLEELAAPASTKPNVALAFVAPAGLKEVQAALGSEVRSGAAASVHVP